jgi:hypothetical protein
MLRIHLIVTMRLRASACSVEDRRRTAGARDREAGINAGEAWRWVQRVRVRSGLRIKVWLLARAARIVGARINTGDCVEKQRFAKPGFLISREKKHGAERHARG